MKQLSSIILSLFAAIVAFGAMPDKEGFVTDWLISGPYPNYQVDGRGQAFDTDFLKDEADVVPYPGLKVKSEFIADWGKLVAGVEATNEWGVRETKSFDATWQKKSSQEFKVVFDKMFLPIDDYFAVYAACWIESPNQRKIRIGTGSDDDHKIYLNGKLVGKHYGSQGTLPDQFNYDAELQPGLNRLMYKLVDRTGGADFCLRLTDVNKHPMNDLKFYTDHPGRKYRAELYQNGYAGNLKFNTPNLFTGEQKLTISVFSDKNDKYSLRLNGKPVTAGTTTINLRDGANLLKLEVIVNGQTVAVLQKEVTAYSKEVLTAENESLRKEIKKNAEMLSAMKTKQNALDKKLEVVMKARKKAYADLEEKYAAQRAESMKDAKKSIDEPMTPATVRSRLCINGEWEASTDRENWSEFVLPAKMYNKYFRNWFNPVKYRDSKDPSSEAIPLKGWEDLKVSPIINAQKVWFRKIFTADGKSTVTLICGAVKGKLQVLVNGELCGDYTGWMGQVEIPLKNVKPGKNLLELNFSIDRRADHSEMDSGIVGDLYLDFTSPVKMADVWVKPDWRKATLTLTSEIENRTDKEQQAEICQYVAKDNCIKLKLPTVRQTLEPNKTTTFKNSEKWADPLLWGIGEKYGNPDMYDLVSDVYVDGKLVDRYVQPFGFREFWIHATDFYLNGKRIILQGDVSHNNIAIPKVREIIWPLLRHDGINIIRYHDSSSQWNKGAADASDRLGMLSYVQMYPVLFSGNVKESPDKFSPFEEWTRTPEHQYNLDNYRRWFRLFRNNPSVVIWSTDNEIFTQAWDTAAKLEFNIRNDKIGALYEKFMKTLDPDLVLTRDGDIGTWSHRGRWFENPPCDTANYHYPEFNSTEQIINWQQGYDYRPVIFGETLYCAYFGKDGASPELIAGRAAQVRSTAGLYRTLEVPGQIFMGLSLDGFVIYDDSGKGNPWGITKTMLEKYKKEETIPPGLKTDQYPWFRIAWPAYSGQGIKIVAERTGYPSWGNLNINWFDPSKSSHIRNAVNDAYKETLLPQPPLLDDNSGECIVTVQPFAAVWSTAIDGRRYGVQADKQGRAWFQLPTSGKYAFESDGVRKEFDVPSRKSYATKPGFDKIVTFELN